MIILFIIILIILIVAIIFMMTNNKNIESKYLEKIEPENRTKFLNNLNDYINNVILYSSKLKLKNIKLEKYENNDFNQTLKWYIEKYKYIHQTINDDLSEKIKNTKYFKTNKSLIIEFLNYIYKFNLPYNKNKLSDYYDIFIEKLNKDLNCCATIWNINLFFEKIIKNFNYRN
jgi:hypothetical protein